MTEESTFARKGVRLRLNLSDMGALLRIRLVLAALACLGSFGTVPALAQSGTQIINGTKVFTQIFPQDKKAMFSNDCGSQILTQAELQQGKMPDRIVPCPRPGVGSPSTDTKSENQKFRDYVKDKDDKERQQAEAEARPKMQQAIDALDAFDPAERANNIPEMTRLASLMSNLYFDLSKNSWARSKVSDLDAYSTSWGCVSAALKFMDSRRLYETSHPSPGFDCDSSQKNNPHYQNVLRQIKQRLEMGEPGEGRWFGSLVFHQEQKSFFGYSVNKKDRKEATREALTNCYNTTQNNRQSSDMSFLNCKEVLWFRSMCAAASVSEDWSNVYSASGETVAQAADSAQSLCRMGSGINCRSVIKVCSKGPNG